MKSDTIKITSFATGFWGGFFGLLFGIQSGGGQTLNYCVMLAIWALTVLLVIFQLICASIVKKLEILHKQTQQLQEELEESRKK